MKVIRLNASKVAVLVLGWAAQAALVCAEVDSRSVAAGTAPLGGRSSSANYSQVATGGELGGRATSAQFDSRVGFLSRTADVVGFRVEWGGPTIDEGQSRPAAAYSVDEYAWSQRLPNSYVGWIGSLEGVLALESSGNLQAGAVYRDEEIPLKAEWAGYADELRLTVLDTLPDNFGSYASDGLPDSWQVGFFGLDNPLASPLVDATGTGQDNRFKYLAGLNPADPTAPDARLRMTLEPAEGAPGSLRIRLEPWLEGRIYTLWVTADLSQQWSPLPVVWDGVPGVTGSAVDSSRQGDRFYRVTIDLP